MELTLSLGPIHEAVTTAVQSLTESDAVTRIWDGDHTLWSPDPTEINDRMGWLHLLDEMNGAVSEMEMFAAGVQADGMSKAVICGMGGSTLFPEVLAKTFTTCEGLTLTVVDTTDPAAIDRILADRQITDTLFVGASKSGSTLETVSQLATFWSRLQRGPQFTVITDPGSAMIALADQHGYRRVFQNRADIGGRFSALSYFGLMPGALVGAPIAKLLDSARELVPELHGPEDSNPAVLLGASMAVAAQLGRDKCTILIDPLAQHLGVWLEQLLAESTGKHGEGVVPIVDEPAHAAAYGDDRFFVVIGSPPGLDQIPADAPVVSIPLAESTDIGAQVLLWEFATAVAGAVLGVNPFDQPNVAAAKAATDHVLSTGIPAIPLVPVPQMLSLLAPGDFINLCAYVDPASGTVDKVTRKLHQLGQRFGVATTMGIGPRYLHSTGQLHKGKPFRFVAIQIMGEDRTDVAIPDQPFTFGQLKAAQAAGDYAALQAVGARVGRVALTEFLDA